MVARRLTKSIAALAVATTVTALLGVPATATTDASPVSTLTWGGCTQPALAAGGFECTTMTVPLDRSGQDRGTVELALVRHVSTGSDDERIGFLVFNPGGPGGSATASIPVVWQWLPDEVKSRFDIVSWDPRGIGATVPALQGCQTPMVQRPLTGPVDIERTALVFQQTLAKANADCQRRNARIAQHMGTNDAVADLDALRAALGEDQLTYWGMSYGTRIGYVYALAHPDRVRAIVLDGSIDPAGTALGLTQGGVGPDQAFGSFANAYPQAGQQLDALLGLLDRRVVPLPDGQRLDRSFLLDLVYGNIAQQSAYNLLASIIDIAYGAVFGDAAEQAALLPRLAAIVAGIRPGLGNGDNAGGAFSMVNCLDYPQRASTARIIDAIRYQHRLGPQFGATLATLYGMGCAGLTITPDPIPVITGAGSPVPVLILGASRDGSTVSGWTTRMSRAFPQSRTVTYAGGQHVTWGVAGSSCVDAVANVYVFTRQLPATDIGCPNAYVAQPLGAATGTTS